MSFFTLPSNVIDVENPDNTNASYTTVLPEPILAAPGEYQIGLTEIQYTNTWNNLNDDYAELRYGAVGGTYQTITARLQNGRYAEHKDVVHEIGRALRGKSFRASGGARLEATSAISILYADATSRCAIRSTDRNLSIRFSNRLAAVLGFDASAWYCPGATAANVIENSNRPDIDAGMTALFVYCNVVSPRCVGGANVRLLRAVTTDRSAAQRNVLREFKHTHYLDVDSGSHRSIKIDIYRDNGEMVPFEGGKVIVTLHMRKKQ